MENNNEVALCNLCRKDFHLGFALSIKIQNPSLFLDKHLQAIDAHSFHFFYI